MEQRSEEWFAARKNLVTGSSVGAILGLDPYRDQDDVMRAMVRQYHGEQPEFLGNIATQWGITHEEEALDDFCYFAMKSVDPASFVIHPTETWIGASPDGYVDSDALLEIKCPFGIRKDENPKFKSAFEQQHYMAQMQVQMFVTGRSKVYFWQWTPRGNRLEVVEYDPDMIAEMIPRLKAFYEKFLLEVDDPDKHLSSGRFVLNNPEVAQIVAEYDDIQIEIARAEDRKKELLEKLVKVAGGHDAIVAGRKLTQVSRAGSISYAKAIKELLPGVDLEKWRGKPTSYWTLK